MSEEPDIVVELRSRFGDEELTLQPTCDAVPTLWVSRGAVRDILRFLKMEAKKPYRMLFDLTAIDERSRTRRQDQPDCDFSVVYYLISFDRNSDIRIKVPLDGAYASLRTITDFWRLFA